MGIADYEYTGLVAEAWDVLRGDTSGWQDRAFYLELIRSSGEPVLDVGCGTGRLLLDYAGLGIDIDGVDNSPEMLALCQQKADARDIAVRVFLQEMVQLALPRRYRTIVVPSSSLQLLTDPADATRTLARLLEHLHPGGILAASFMTLWVPGQALTSQWESSAQRIEDGAVFRRWARSRFDPDANCEHTEDHYQKLVDGQVVAEEHHRRSPATRSYTQEQARALVEGAGFQDVSVLHEFTFDAADPGDPLFVVMARRPR
ncbi:MAG TPA: class I SAM-dependent methyltransferase [Candidatus Nanopelagicales bacterium]